MRRLTVLVVVTVICWGLAMACSGGGVPQSPGAVSGPGTGDSSGGINPPVPGGGGGGGGGGDGGGSGGDVPMIPTPVVTLSIGGKPVVQDGVYAATELKVHASDAKGQATTFHWSLMGTGIAGGSFADGADATFKLPSVTDKSAYELTAIGSLGGKAVQQTINFFTVPSPTAAIKANVNQTVGLPVVLPSDGVVLKGQKIQFSADAKFANQYKWQVSKDGAKAQELGTTESVTFDAKDIGQYQVALQVWGDGGFSPMVLFNFVVNDNAVAVKVTSKVTKDNFSAEFVEGGQYPVGATLTIDTSGIQPAIGLESASCVLKDPNAKEQAALPNVNLNAVGKNTVTCTYKVKAGYAEAAGSVLSSSVSFEVLSKAKAVIWVDGKPCDPATPVLFQVGSKVFLSANGSEGNIKTYSWFSSLGGVEEPEKPNSFLTLKDAVGYAITLTTKGIGDSDSISCVVFSQPLPNAVIASNSTVKDGRSYISGSYQQALAKMTKGVADTFDWSLLNAGGTVLQNSTTQNALVIFEFALSEVGELTLKLTSKLMNLVGPSSVISVNSKVGQVSLITPVDFATAQSPIQSIAAVNSSDVYFASSTAIFHKGVDGRVVQVKNISDHLASPDGFFARNAGDIYLLTTDGGFWRYTFKDGWVYASQGAGTNQLAIAGPSTGTRLFVAANSRLFAGDVSKATWTKIGNGQRYVTTQGDYAYAAASASVAAGAGTDPAVVKCTPQACTALQWAIDPNALVTWKAIGANTTDVYLSASNGRIYALQNGLLVLLGSFKNDDYVVSFFPRGTVMFAMGNKGGVYQMASTGITPLYAAPVTVTHAAGINDMFWAWDATAQKTIFVKDANPVAITAQQLLGASIAPCADQKPMWMFGETAYVSVCSVPAGKGPLYTIWSAPYQGDFKPDMSLVSTTPAVGMTSDGAGGLFVMRSDGANINYIQYLAAGAPAPQNVNIALGVGEFFTGMSGKFIITSQGIIVNDGQNYPLAKAIVGVHHPVAIGNVLYFSYQNDARLAVFDLAQNKMDDIANVDPLDPIVDVMVDANGRVYVLTAKTLYRYDSNATLTKIYDALAPLMNSMASMNGHHILVSLGGKGGVLVDVNGKDPNVTVDLNIQAATGLNITAVGYNGTEFMLFGHDNVTNALFLHQFGAPQ